jgi:hypothetical protein
METSTSTETQYDFSSLDSQFSKMTFAQKADEAVRRATNQLIASTEFKKPRMERIEKFWKLYDGKTEKKLRQIFNVPIPVFAGMIDTLNAQYDTPIQLTFGEGDPADYFKVQKINGAFRLEVLNSQGDSKWEAKLRMQRKHAIMQGRGILRFNVESDPEYHTELINVPLKYFHFQPKGGGDLEKHMFAGQENIQRTKSELIKRANAGVYDKKQVYELITTAENNEYLPDNSQDTASKLERFKPLGLDPTQHSYIGEPVYTLAEWIMEIDGERWYLVFHPWTKKWVRFEKWKDVRSSGKYPWFSYATHEDDENFLSKAYGDDLYVAADAIVAMFNQELTNREKRNNGSRAFDKDMFTDVRKLDEAMHRPDGLIPADTKGGTRRISEGVFEFKVGELNGTINLIDWITDSLGRNTGANDLQMGEVQDVSKKASVTFAEQKSVSKRISWAAAPFQEMMASLGSEFIWGLKDHMPARMAIRVLGENGWDWQEITRLDLSTEKDIDVIITSTDKQLVENESKAKKRQDVLTAIGADPNLAGIVNSQWRLEQLLRVGEFEDVDVAVAMDSKNFSDRKALAHASEAIQQILLGQTPQKWFGANRAFVQRITDYASDKRATLGDKFDKLIQYAMSHVDIVKTNIERQVREETMMSLVPAPAPTPVKSPMDQNTSQNPGVSGGVSRAMSIGNAMA